MEIDAIGKAAVCDLIRQSALPKFLIFRQGGGTRIPVFECTKTASADRAADSFASWAAAVGSGGQTGAVYEILLFSHYDEREDEDGGIEVKGRSKKLSGKIRFSFSLDRSAAQSSSGPVDLQAAISAALEKMTTAQREDKLLQAIEAMNARIEAIEAEAEEDDDEEEEKDKTGLGALGGFLSSPLAAALLPSLLGTKPEAPPVLNGMPSEADTSVPPMFSQEEREKINRACVSLKKHDPQLADDLIRLSNLAEKSPVQFQFMLSTLRRM